MLPDTIRKDLNGEFIRAWKNRYGEDLPHTNGTEGRGSSDTGDVSCIMPCAQYYFGVTGGEAKALHTVEFREAAASDAAFQSTMETAAAMSDVAFRYFADAAFRGFVHEAWKKESARSRSQTENSFFDFPGALQLKKTVPYGILP